MERLYDSDNRKDVLGALVGPATYRADSVRDFLKKREELCPLPSLFGFAQYLQGSAVVEIEGVNIRSEMGAIHIVDDTGWLMVPPTRNIIGREVEIKEDSSLVRLAHDPYLDRTWMVGYV